MIRKYLLRPVLTSVAATFLLVGHAAAQDKATLILDWVPDGSYAAFFAGIDQGFYRDAGIDLTIERGFGSSDTVTKIATGVAEFGIADIGALMAGRLRAQTPVTAIASIYTRPPHSIFVLEGSGIESFKDLEGRSLAGAPGSAVRVFLPLVLEREGVDIEQINLINAEPATMGPLLVSGQADAVTGFLTNRPRFDVMAAEQGKVVNVLEFADAIQIYGNALIAADSTISDSADLTRRFVAATIKALEFGRDTPEEAVASMMKMVPGLNPVGDGAAIEVHNFLTFESDVAARLPVGAFDTDQLRETWEIVAEAQEFDPAAIDPEVFVTREFLP